MEKGPDGTYPYKSPVDCAMKTFTQEGPLKFYTGFPTYCFRWVEDRSHVCACMLMQGSHDLCCQSLHAPSTSGQLLELGMPRAASPDQLEHALQPTVFAIGSPSSPNLS